MPRTQSRVNLANPLSASHTGSTSPPPSLSTMLKCAGGVHFTTMSPRPFGAKATCERSNPAAAAPFGRQ